ncbi:twin-arginine translocase subunit TatC [Microbacterium betulae]|uniref:Sec-independent protein translocase protein TatC n=1 Tax=Microbacterium betulae TaxID=2981139 RepID=A0AA97I7P3_9MICO|nr:twin-arginine translocase subunit TatC [Microbacterium sp. AB]WOF24492.1 twin-arginine translocase subunit TatC [Microbacterium sp. AB]
MASTDTDATVPDDLPYRDRRMTLAAHLVELRKRLMIAAAALVVGMVVAFLITDPVIELLTRPIQVIAGERGDDFAQLNFDSVTAGFDMRMRIAFAIGLLLSAPVWMWQIWAFVMPGLTRKEVKYSVGFMAAAVPLFFAGCYVGLLIMPHIIELMASFVPDSGAQFYKYDYYYDFVFKLLLVLGVAFVSPVFLVALNLAGIITGKAILKGWRVAVVVATAFAAISTPAADVTSMLLLAGILILLYMLAGLLSMLFDRRKRKRNPELFAEPAE